MSAKNSRTTVEDLDQPVWELTPDQATETGGGLLLPAVIPAPEQANRLSAAANATSEGDRPLESLSLRDPWCARRARVIDEPACSSPPRKAPARRAAGTREPVTGEQARPWFGRVR